MLLPGNWRDNAKDEHRHLHMRTAEEILQRAAEAICSPLNGIMCRWEPPGKGLGNVRDQ